MTTDRERTMTLVVSIIVLLACVTMLLYEVFR